MDRKTQTAGAPAKRNPNYPPRPRARDAEVEDERPAIEARGPVYEVPAKGSTATGPLYAKAPVRGERQTEESYKRAVGIYEKRQHITVDVELAEDDVITGFRHRIALLLAQARGFADGVPTAEWVKEWKQAHRDIVCALVLSVSGVRVGNIDLDRVKREKLAEHLDFARLIVDVAQAALRLNTLGVEDADFFG